MNKRIKTLIAEKGALYKRLKRNMLNSRLLDKPDALQAKLQISINFNLSTTRKYQEKFLIHPVVVNAI